MHFIYYINRLIAKKVDSTYLGRGGRELVTFRLQNSTLSLYTTHIDIATIHLLYEITTISLYY